MLGWHIRVIEHNTIAQPDDGDVGFVVHDEWAVT
jgi:hypothetical protein